MQSLTLLPVASVRRSTELRATEASVYERSRREVSECQGNKTLSLRNISDMNLITEVSPSAEAAVFNIIPDGLCQGAEGAVQDGEGVGV